LGDPDLLARATQIGRVLFSQDEDLLAIADHWLHTKREFTDLMSAPQLDITIVQAVRDFMLIA
jgi:hypothetical protein